MLAAAEFKNNLLYIFLLINKLILPINKKIIVNNLYKNVILYYYFILFSIDVINIYLNYIVIFY